MDNFLAALRFLTIIPLPGKKGHDESAISGSPPFFPVIGLLTGLLAAGLSWLFWAWLAPLSAAVLSVIVLLVVSGGLHMDGLCDTADGFFSARPRARMLEIMRDSRVGAMGVMAIVLILALKIAALSVHSQDNIWPVVLLMPLAGRVSLLVLMAVLPYARPEGGLATLFYKRPGKLAAISGVFLLLAVGWLVLGSAGLIAGGLAMGVVLSFAAYCRYKIGGATGDTLGAGCELAETAIALVLAVKPLFPMG